MKYHEPKKLYIHNIKEFIMVEKKTTDKAKRVKKGGNVVQDLQNLAVPFGILLAKKGLDSIVSKDAAKSKKEPKEGAKGGSTAAKKPKKVAKKGGTVGSKNLEKEFTDLSNQIEKFLNKY